MNAIMVTCNNCDGYGCEPNWFDLPTDPFKICYYKDDKPRTSKGREYTGAKCHICNGSGSVLTIAPLQHESRR